MGGFNLCSHPDCLAAVWGCAPPPTFWQGQAQWGHQRYHQAGHCSLPATPQAWGVLVLWGTRSCLKELSGLEPALFVQGLFGFLYE